METTKQQTSSDNALAATDKSCGEQESIAANPSFLPREQRPDPKQDTAMAESELKEEHPLSFGFAFRRMEAGNRVARTAWGQKGRYLQMQFPDEGSKMTAPYIFEKTEAGWFVPWSPNQIDMFAKDWINIR